MTLLPRLALILGLAIAPAARAETLADAMAAAYENSGLLDQNRAVLRAADEDVAQAVASLRPVINWQLQYSSTHPGSIFA
jgi:outer membrane protein